MTSLPVVVISDPKQEANAAATIMWHNVFSANQPISIPSIEHVSWKAMKNAIYMEFLSKTGCSLTEENLEFLCECCID